MKFNIQKMTFIALMAAIICVLAPISIPLPAPAPAITLATFAVYLSAYILGPINSLISVLIYVLLGCVGLPVFSKGQAGFQVLAGPTGGYIIGYFFIAVLTGLFVVKFSKKVYMHLVGILLGTAICYAFGTVWLGVSLHLTPAGAIAAGVTPYLVTDAIKIVAVIVIAYPLRKQLLRAFPEAFRK